MINLVTDTLELQCTDPQETRFALGPRGGTRANARAAGAMATGKIWSVFDVSDVSDVFRCFAAFLVRFGMFGLQIRPRGAKACG